MIGERRKQITKIICILFLHFGYKNAVSLNDSTRLNSNSALFRGIISYWIKSWARFYATWKSRGDEIVTPLDRHYAFSYRCCLDRSTRVRVEDDTPVLEKLLTFSRKKKKTENGLTTFFYRNSTYVCLI